MYMLVKWQQDLAEPSVVLLVTMCMYMYMYFAQDVTYHAPSRGCITCVCVCESV